MYLESQNDTVNARITLPCHLLNESKDEYGNKSFSGTKQALASLPFICAWSNLYFYIASSEERWRMSNPLMSTERLRGSYSVNIKLSLSLPSKEILYLAAQVDDLFWRKGDFILMEWLPRSLWSRHKRVAHGSVLMTRGNVKVQVTADCRLQNKLCRVKLVKCHCQSA